MAAAEAAKGRAASKKPSRLFARPLRVRAGSVFLPVKGCLPRMPLLFLRSHRPVLMVRVFSGRCSLLSHASARCRFPGSGPFPVHAGQFSPAGRAHRGDEFCFSVAVFMGIHQDDEEAPRSLR